MSGGAEADAEVLAGEIRETKLWAARLEAELAAHRRERDAEREGCAQVFRDLRAEVRGLRRQFANAVAESVELERCRAALASDLRLERRERRRAVQFIADQDLLGAYAAAEHAPELELPARSRSTTQARPDHVVDALAPTQRPEALKECADSTLYAVPIGVRDGIGVPEAGPGASRRR